MRLWLFGIALAFLVALWSVPAFSGEWTVIFEKGLPDGISAVIKKSQKRKNIAAPKLPKPSEEPGLVSGGGGGSECDVFTYRLMVKAEDGKERCVWEKKLVIYLKSRISGVLSFHDITKNEERIAILYSTTVSVHLNVVETSKEGPPRVLFSGCLESGLDPWTRADVGNLIFMGKDIYALIGDNKENRIGLWLLRKDLLRQLYPPPKGRKVNIPAGGSGNTEGFSE